MALSGISQSLPVVFTQQSVQPENKDFVSLVAIKALEWVKLAFSLLEHIALAPYYLVVNLTGRGSSPDNQPISAGPSAPKKYFGFSGKEITAILLVGFFAIGAKHLCRDYDIKSFSPAKLSVSFSSNTAHCIVVALVCANLVAVSYYYFYRNLKAANSALTQASAELTTANNALTQASAALTAANNAVTAANNLN